MENALERNLLTAALAGVLALTTIDACAAWSTEGLAKADGSPYKFVRGFPAVGTAGKAYDAADLRRATEASKFSQPTGGE